MIAARVDRLEQQSKRILQEASVIGRSFYYDILKRISDIKDNIDKGLSGLERFDLNLIKTKSIQPYLEYIFKHALTQEVVYNGLLKWALVFYYRGDFKLLTELLEVHKAIAESLDNKALLGMFYGWLGFALCERESFKKSYEYLSLSLSRYYFIAGPAFSSNNTDCQRKYE